MTKQEFGRERLSTATHLDDESELSEDEEDILDSLLTPTPSEGKGEDEEDDHDHGQPWFEWVDCWSAELFCDGRHALSVEHLLFGSREDLLQLLRWLTAFIRDVPEATAAPIADARSAREWEEMVGHTYLTMPTEPDDWTLLRGNEGVCFWAAGRQVLTSSAEFKPSELDGFLTWLKDEIGTAQVDPPPPARPDWMNLGPDSASA